MNDAAPSTFAASLLREHQPHGHARVTYVELFFDLIFVFAITQLSHRLAQVGPDLSVLMLGSAASATLVLVAAWEHRSLGGRAA